MLSFFSAILIAVSASSFPILGAASNAWFPKIVSELKEISIYSFKEINGKVLAAAEEVKTTAPQLASFMGLGDRLPENSDKPSAPVKIGQAPSFELSGSSGILVDARTNSPLFEKESQKQLPIASITKLMAALVFLDHNSGWETVYEISAQDKREGGRIYLFTGEKIKIKDLFYASLVASDNVATAALVKSTGLSEEEFVAAMNEKATALGLKNTRFKDPIGLDNGDISTAGEIAMLAAIAFANTDISRATLVKKYEFSTLDGRKKIIYSTDSLLDIFPQNGIKILGGKTGYTEAAGYCFVGKFSDRNNHEMIAVILGDAGDESRFRQTHDLVNWAYENYQWQN